ncbi:MAG: NHL repeat-containing protein [Candidatus Kryptonium sp.]
MLLGIFLQPSQREEYKIDITFLFKFGNLNLPRGISVSPTGDIYVADTGNNSIKKFTRDGKLIRDVTGYGWGELEFDLPSDVDAGNGVAVYVADYNNHRVQRFDKNLNFIASFQGEIGGEKFFGFPLSAAVSKFGELFIIDENLRCVKINKFNQIEKTFGGIEAGAGRLINPIQITLTFQNLIAILDGNHILIYDYYGNFLRKFGDQYLKTPTGLFADSLLYVADGNEIFIFEINGKLLGKITSPEKIYDLVRQGNLLYCLTDNEIVVYKLTFSRSRRY